LKYREEITAPEQNTLKREFGLITVTLLVVGMLVGSGIFQKIINPLK
jgi:hypothetical protein